MIRAILKREDKPDLIVLGIDRGNVERLTGGKLTHASVGPPQPILVEGEPMGLPFDIVVLYGRTLADVKREIEAAGVDMPDVELPDDAA